MHLEVDSYYILLINKELIKVQVNSITEKTYTVRTIPQGDVKILLKDQSGRLQYNDYWEFIEKIDIFQNKVSFKKPLISEIKTNL